MRLYNYENQEWRKGNFHRGDSFRSDIIYQCFICHTKTNRWVMGGSMSLGPRLLCPADKYGEHDEIESTLEKYINLNGQIKEFEQIVDQTSDTNIDMARTQTMIENLYVQRDLLKLKIRELRGFFLGKFDDVQGLDDSVEIEKFYPSSRIVGRKKSIRPF